MSDPLSFFAAKSDSDDDDTSDDDKNNVEVVTVSKSVSDDKSGKKLLPPPIDVLSGVTKLEFIEDESKKDVDWDRLTKKAPLVPEKEYKPWEERLPTVEQSVKTKAGKKEKTLAQQAPGASAPNKAEGPLEGRPLELIDNAIHWSKMYQTMDASGNVKRVRPEEIGGEEGLLFTDLEAQKNAFTGLKRKGDHSKSHRTKEAKKRSLGQSNRDKMFVEEEKRMLRQDFANNY